MSSNLLDCFISPVVLTIHLCDFCRHPNTVKVVPVVDNCCVLWIIQSKWDTVFAIELLKCNLFSLL